MSDKHVFVSHSHKDSNAANSIVAALEERGTACWIAPRNVQPGGSYAESILNAIQTASCFVLIYSENCNVSSHVLREVERALSFGVNIVPVRFDDSTPSKSLDYLLATVHWLAIPQESRERSITKAAEQIADWLTNFLKNPASPLPLRASPLQAALVTPLEQPRNRGGLLAGAVMVLALAGAAAAYTTGHIPSLTKVSPKDQITASPRLNSHPAASPPIAHRGPSLKPTPVAGYAGVNNPLPNRGNPVPFNNNTINQAQGTVPDPRMQTQNPNGMFGPPPPPQPGGPQMSQFGNGPGGPPPNGGYGPPPPPPPPGGRSMFGPPPNQGGPRP